MQLRAATLSDVPALSALIAQSIHALALGHYTRAQTEGALAVSYFGVDTELLEDRSYFVIETQGRLAACGGWSRRKTLFGGNQASVREEGFLDPQCDPAKIRAFFVHPAFARKGLGKRLLAHSEAEARAQGFTSFVLMATLSGVAFYEAHGYHAEKEEDFPLQSGLSIRGVHMRKDATTV